MRRFARCTGAGAGARSSEEEANKLLLTLDPLAAMAESDAERISALLQMVSTENPAVEELLRRTAGERLWEQLHPDEVKEVERERVQFE